MDEVCSLREANLDLYHQLDDLIHCLRALWGLESNEPLDLLKARTTSSLLHLVRYEHVDEMLASAAGMLEPLVARHDVFLAVAPPVEDHLEPGQMAVLFSDHREVSEMQDETQEAAATSSPDPLTLLGLEDRDIDVFPRPPNSAGSCEA